VCLQTTVTAENKQRISSQEVRYLKILYINVLFNSGSTGKIVYELYSHARAEGHEAAVCYGRGRKRNEENVFKFGLDWETKLHALLTRLTGLTGCFSPFSTARLIAFMDTFKPDIIHLHEPHAYFVNLRPLFDYISSHNIPLVYTMHCEFAFTGKCGHPLRCENWRTGCGNCPCLSDYPKTFFFDFTAKMLSDKLGLLKKQNMLIVSPSVWLASRIKQSLIENKDIRVIPNGIDTKSIFYPRAYEHLKIKHGIENKKIVLAVAPGIMSSHKGGAELLRLAKALENENIKFIFIGMSSAEARGSFPENIIPLAHTEDQQQLAEYYSMADCFVICSDMENLPTTCLEAVCCGTPVAGYDTGGTKETVPAPLGRFAPYGDTEALAESVMLQLKTSFEPSDYESLRNAYSSKSMYKAYEALYDQLVCGRKEHLKR